MSRKQKRQGKVHHRPWKKKSEEDKKKPDIEPIIARALDTPTKPVVIQPFQENALASLGWAEQFVEGYAGRQTILLWKCLVLVCYSSTRISAPALEYLRETISSLEEKRYQRRTPMREDQRQPIPFQQKRAS